MAVEKELLWEAYPEGYLAMRGVSTVANWTCIHANEPLSRWAYGQWGSERPREFNIDSDIKKTVHLAFGLAENDVRTLLLEGGGLLPNVDPSDPATWSCLLVDLAKAIGKRDAYGARVGAVEWSTGGLSGIMWSRVYCQLGDDKIRKPMGWQLWLVPNRSLQGGASLAHRRHEVERIFHAAKDNDDPAEALVLARIQVREETGR